MRYTVAVRGVGAVNSEESGDYSSGGLPVVVGRWQDVGRDG